MMNSLVLFLSSMLVGDFQTGPLLVQVVGDSGSSPLNMPRTVLCTDNNVLSPNLSMCWWATFRKLKCSTGPRSCRQKQEAWHQCAGGRLCSTSEVLSPRTVLTENICESVQEILPHSPAQNTIVELTKHDAFLYCSSSCPMWWWATARKLGRCCSGLFHVGVPLA